MVHLHTEFIFSVVDRIFFEMTKKIKSIQS